MTEEENIVIEARKYELLDNLTKQDGWPILLQHLEKVKQALILGLLKEQDHTKIITLQARHRAFSSVVETLQSAKNIKDKLYHDIDVIVEETRLKEEFDI